MGVRFYYQSWRKKWSEYLHFTEVILFSIIALISEILCNFVKSLIFSIIFDQKFCKIYRCLTVGLIVLYTNNHGICQEQFIKHLHQTSRNWRCYRCFQGKRKMPNNKLDKTKRFKLFYCRSRYPGAYAKACLTQLPSYRNQSIDFHSKSID